MNGIKKYALCGLIVSVLAAMCLSYGCRPGEESNIRDQGTAAAAEDQGIELSPAQMKAVGIVLDTIARKNMHAVVAAAGQLAVPPQNRADVNVLTGGIVRRIYVQEGEVVKKGQVLALLENPDFIQLQQDYLTAENTFAFTTEEKQRQQELNEAQAGTGKNLQQVQAAFNAQKAKILTLKKQLQVLGIDPESVAEGNIVSDIAVRAPISGTVGHIIVNTGTYASTDKPLMEIIDNSKVHADLIVFEKDLFKVRVGQKVQFVLTNQDNRQITGKIYGINKSFENETKGIIVHAAIQNAEKWQLIPGMYVRGLINIGNDVVAAVPEEAVVHTEGKDFVFILDSAGGEKKRFRRSEVIPGIRELGFVQVTPLEDLKPNTRVVVRGAFYLLSSEKAAGDEEE